ncbi:hypothetical protein [Neisseria polysaccharea]|uniref:hypothetical protein n=1 Tax=Neisseria polysaccharea TaxID=489 RepID=UPI000E1E121C|nr:hypothetical protein [Neisseria polysaccharea]
MSSFGQAERDVQSYFEIGQVVRFNGQSWCVQTVGKPTCGNGEPKTDIYILLKSESSEEIREIKISYKKSNADFVENKIKADRAEIIFGNNWAEIIQSSTTNIRRKFLDKNLIFKKSKGRTDNGSITLGWKFELVNKLNGELSDKVDLTTEQLLDIYVGNNLDEEKKNASVNGVIIPNSGVANYILIGDEFSSTEEILDKIVSLDEYVRNNPNIYFACKALNYRSFEDKFDGDRPLAVQVKWEVVNGKLTHELIFDKPFQCNGNKVAKQLKQCLINLGVQNTDDLNDKNTQDCNIFQ